MIHLEGPDGRYTIGSAADAKKVCLDNGYEMATIVKLSEAQKNGYEKCRYRFYVCMYFM